jgi:hypothetical protein
MHRHSLYGRLSAFVVSYHPQLPHFFDLQPAQLFPDDEAALEAPELLTLKADISRVTSDLLHLGHCTWASRLRTRSSNFFLHLLQRNSYMGMV